MLADAMAFSRMFLGNEYNEVVLKDREVDREKEGGICSKYT